MVLIELALGLGTIILLWNVLASFIWSVVMRFEPQWKKKMPGPKPSSLLLGGLEFFRDNYEEPYKPLPELSEKYGPIFLLRGLLPRATVVVVAEPKLAAAALQSDTKGAMYDMMRVKGEQNVFMTDGPYWHFSRKLMNPAFSSQAIKGMFPIMVDEAKIFVKYLNSLVDNNASDPVDISNVLQQVTLDVIMKTAFGYNIYAVGNTSSKDLAIIQEGLDEATRRARSILRLLNPWSKMIEMRYRKHIKQLATKCVEARKNNPEELKTKKDLLTLLINAEDNETGEKLKDDQIVQEVLVFMLAGHETTAHSMTWFMYHLAQYPEWQIKVQQEIDQLFGNRDYPEHEDMNNMKVLTMILNESMRMTPVAPFAPGRELKEDVTIDGYFIPKGTSVWAPIYLFHHNPRLWDKPEEFNPERFDNQTHYPKFAPFTTGPRSCIGQVFAKDEMKSILSSFVRHFSWTLAPGVVVQPHLAITLKPKNGLPVILKKRVIKI